MVELGRATVRGVIQGVTPHRLARLNLPRKLRLFFNATVYITHAISCGAT
jgi:hypothetical protein